MGGYDARNRLATVEAYNLRTNAALVPRQPAPSVPSPASPVAAWSSRAALLVMLATSHQSRPTPDRVDAAPTSAAHASWMATACVLNGRLYDGRYECNQLQVLEMLRKMSSIGQSKPNFPPGVLLPRVAFSKAGCGSWVALLLMARPPRSSRMIPIMIRGHRDLRSLVLLPALVRPRWTAKFTSQALMVRSGFTGTRRGWTCQATTLGIRELPSSQFVWGRN